jgi:hypothetical protein
VSRALTKEPGQKGLLSKPLQKASSRSEIFLSMISALGLLSTTPFKKKDSVPSQAQTGGKLRRPFTKRRQESSVNSAMKSILGRSG